MALHIRNSADLYFAIVDCFSQMDEDLLYAEESRFLFSHMPVLYKDLLNFTWEGDACKEIDLWKSILPRLKEKEFIDQPTSYFLSHKVQPGAMGVTYGVYLFLNNIHDKDASRSDVKQAIHFLTQGRKINDFSVLLQTALLPAPWANMPEFKIEKRQTIATSQASLDDVLVEGRIESMRIHKNVIFCNLLKQHKLVQLCIEIDLEEVEKKIKVGDYLEVSGDFGMTKRGNEALFVKKIIQHIPTELMDKDHFIRLWKDKSSYLATIDKVKKFMRDQDFFEVSTPILYDSYEGGTSRPFMTFENHAEATNYLRVTSEVTILKYIAGGAEKVFEIGSSFRNENNRDRKSVEYDLFESYSTLHSFDEFYELMLRLLKDLLPQHATHTVIDYMGVFRDLKVDINNLSDLQAFAKKHDIAIDDVTCPIEASRVIFKKQVANMMTGMTIINNIPGKGSPYIKGLGENAKRSWVIIDGLDVAEIAENEINYDDFTSKLHRQFADDDQYVLRDSTEIRQCLLSGLPKIVGIGLGVARLHALTQNNST